MDLIIALCVSITLTAMGCNGDRQAQVMRKPEAQKSTATDALDVDAPGDSNVPGIVPKDLSRELPMAQGQSSGQSELTDANGPTIWLDYSEVGRMNPTEDFMYFVPLISPTLVVREISQGNTQTGRMVSVKRSTSGEFFTCECVFKMLGEGRQTCHFDADQMIRHNLKDHETGKPLKNILEYIQFQGHSEGRMVTRGRFIGGRATVTDVEIHFVNGKEDTSPVTIQLYSVRPEDGRYNYENAHARIVARVDSISFQRTETIPKMAINIASIRNEGAKEGWWANFKGAIANLLIPPLEVTRTGNDTMIEFGRAMYDGRKAFTFPKAPNLLEKTASESKPQPDAEEG